MRAFRDEKQPKNVKCSDPDPSQWLSPTTVGGVWEQLLAQSGDRDEGFHLL